MRTFTNVGDMRAWTPTVRKGRGEGEPDLAELGENDI